MRIRYWAVRALSLILFASALGMIWYWAGPLAVGFALVFGTIVLTLPVFGELLSVFIFWTGRVVTSCPNCPDFTVHKVTIESSQCDWCGHRETHYSDPIGGFRIHSYRDGQQFDYCSRSCSNAHKNARSVADD